MKKYFSMALLLTAAIFISGCGKDEDVPKSGAKQITALVFKADQNPTLAVDVATTIDQEKGTITATVPFGTDVTALVPSITVSAGATFSPTGARDFSDPVSYSVTAEDGTTVAYTITVGAAANGKNEILAFGFLTVDNPGLARDVATTIDQEKGTITATVPFGTDLTGLVPTIGFTAGAAIDPVAGATDFSSDVVYTITAMDASKATYTVSVTVAENSEKELTSFAFLATSNTELDADVIATIDEGAKTVSATVPFGTDLTDLTPTIGITPGAAIDPVAGPTDFSGPVVYTITAEDGSKAVYTISVAQQDPTTDRQVLVDIFKRNPGNTFGDSWQVDNPDSDISTWKGVSVDEDGRVVALHFGDDNDEESLFNLIAIPASIGKLTKLTYLNLASNQLTDIPKEIGNLTQLTYLNLFSNQLTDIPAEFGNLTQLTFLSLSSNQLTDIPAEIWNLTQLTYLALRSNQLTAIPKEIGNLTQLMYLYLDLNQLTAIPKEIGNLTQLAYLHLDLNQLTAIPAEIENLTQLEALGLKFNNLKTIPAEIGNLSKLRYLFLESNQLITIPRKVCDLTLTGTVIFKDNGVGCE